MPSFLDTLTSLTYEKCMSCFSSSFYNFSNGINAGTLDAVTKMIRYEGVLGFYKGMGTKIVQSVFAASVLFMVKEELVKAYMVLADKSKKVLLNLSK